MKRIVAFDFDGTYTTRDSLPCFLKASFGRLSYWWGVLLYMPWIVLFKLGIVKGGEAKERLISHFVKGMPYAEFQALCRAFKSHETTMRRPEAHQAMRRALDDGDQVLVVTASVRDWVEPWFGGMDVEVLATELEVDADGLITGRFSRPNCNGAEKWRRIVEAVPDVEQRELVAYGDSGGDSVMLSHADKAYWRSFDQTMDNIPNHRRHPDWLFWLALALLVLYQMLGVFFGMDVADAGFYLTFYDNIFTHPADVEYNFMYYLSGVIGGAFQSLFPSMGMMEMRLLGVAFNTLCAIVLYGALRQHIDVRAIVLGCALVVTSFIAPPYTFCYDLCTIVFYVLAITALWRGLENRNPWLALVAGMMAGLNILVRIPNVLGLSMALVPVIACACDKRHGWRQSLICSLFFLAGAAMAVILTIALMPDLHRTVFYEVLHDLRDIAADESGTASHSTGQMIMTQLKFYGVQAWAAIKLGVPVIVYWSAHKRIGNKWLMWTLKALAIAVFAWLVYRMHPLQPVWLMCLVGGIMVMVENWHERRGIVWMALLGIGMMLVMPLGSDGAYNNGTIVAWAIAPVAMLWWLRRDKVAFPLALIAVCALRMLTVGAYFDGGPLWEKRCCIDNDRAAHIYTTRERADVLNTMLQGISPHVTAGDVLMAYGSSPLINYLTRTRPYIGCSWVEQLSATMLEQKLKKAPKGELPLVLQQKFSTLGMYWSEPIEDFRTDYGDQQNTYRDNRKLEVLNAFLSKYDYRVVYEDTHFVLYRPLSRP